MVRATTRRRSSERQVGFVKRPAIAFYRLLPRLFDVVIGPMLQAVSFSPEQTESTAGNVFDA